MDFFFDKSSYIFSIFKNKLLFMCRIIHVIRWTVLVCATVTTTHICTDWIMSNAYILCGTFVDILWDENCCELNYELIMFVDGALTWHDRLSWPSVYPGGHVHWYDPRVFSHTPKHKLYDLCTSHSLISVFQFKWISLWLKHFDESFSKSKLTVARSIVFAQTESSFTCATIRSPVIDASLFA